MISYSFHLLARRVSPHDWVRGSHPSKSAKGGAAAINHLNICTIYDIGKSGQQSFIAMQFPDGERSLPTRREQGIFRLFPKSQAPVEALCCIACRFGRFSLWDWFLIWWSVQRR